MRQLQRHEDSCLLSLRVARRDFIRPDCAIRCQPAYPADLNNCPVRAHVRMLPVCVVRPENDPAFVTLIRAQVRWEPTVQLHLSLWYLSHVLLPPAAPQPARARLAPTRPGP